MWLQIGVGTIDGPDRSSSTALFVMALYSSCLIKLSRFSIDPSKTYFPLTFKNSMQHRCSIAPPGFSVLRCLHLHPRRYKLALHLFIYLFICDVYTGNPIQQRWFKRRPVLHALYTQFTHFIEDSHNTGNFMPYSFRIMCGFFNVPQNWQHSRVVRRGLRFIVVIREDLKV